MIATLLCSLLSGSAPMLVFDDVTYVHRWSKAGQHEFTPRSQPDLDRWTDMVTIDVHEEARDGDQLATLANAVLGRYQASGRILKTDSKERTKDHPAEHFAAAILVAPKFLEAVFAKFLLVDGRGIVVVYSHRVYGSSAGNEMSTWVDSHGPSLERTLRAWDGIPPLEDLRALTAAAETPAALEEESAKARRDAAVRELAEYGYAPVAHGTYKGIDGSSLVIAAGDGYEDLVKLLLAAGVPVDAPLGSSKRTALAAAVDAGYLDIAATLLAAGANAKVRDENDDTPFIHVTKYCDEIELVRTFIKKGADVNAATRAGWTALKEAENGHCTAIAAELRKAGARK